MRARHWIPIAVLAAAVPVGLVSLTGARGVATGAEESPPTVQVVGLMVNAAVGAGQSPDFPELAFFGTFAHTRVALKLDLPRGGIVDLVREQSTLAAFSDDHERDLRKADDMFGPFEMQPRVAADGRSVVFVADSKIMPHPKASQLRLAGEAAVRVADETETQRSATVDLAEGAQLAVGPYTFVVKESGDSQWGSGWSLTLASHTDPAAVVRWTLVDADGQTAELRPSMSMSGNGNWQQTLEGEQAHARGALELEYWKEPEIVRVPFDVTLGLGLR